LAYTPETATNRPQDQDFSDHLYLFRNSRSVTCTLAEIFNSEIAPKNGTTMFEKIYGTLDGLEVEKTAKKRQWNEKLKIGTQNLHFFTICRNRQK
jgi:hypothetical protein